MRVPDDIRQAAPSRHAALPWALVIGALVLGPSPADAQRWSPALEERGWIGISFEVQSDRWGRTSEVVITDVSDGSPADDAGVRPGDRLVGINEFTRASELAALTERLYLRPGDPVVMEVERAGERYRMRLQATERPYAVDIERRVRVVLAPEEQVETWVRSMDSLRIELIQSGRGTIRVRAAGTGQDVAVLPSPGEAPRAPAPFEFFAFRNEDDDTLHESVRMEYQVRVPSPEQPERRVTGVLARASTSEPRAEFRPLTPYLLGRNRVAGAEVVEVRPELAEYFAVDGGVLVVDVAPQTPAALAGIVPGDVIVRIDGIDVRSVDDLRFGVSMASDSLPVTLVRKGETLEVRLRY